MPAVIQAEHLTKRFGKKVLAVDDVSFAIESGTITGVLAQRRRQDTTLRMILDLVPTAGSGTILGSRYRELARPPHGSARSLTPPGSTPAAPGATPCASSPREPASPTAASTRRSRWSSWREPPSGR